MNRLLEKSETPTRKRDATPRATEAVSSGGLGEADSDKQDSCLPFFRTGGQFMQPTEGVIILVIIAVLALASTC